MGLSADLTSDFLIDSRVVEEKIDATCRDSSRSW